MLGVRWQVKPAFVGVLLVTGVVFGALGALHGAGSGPAADLLARALTGPPALVGVAWAVGLAATMTLHEAGHAYAARLVGADGIVVHLGGLGRTTYHLADPWSARRALVVAAGIVLPLILVPALWVPYGVPTAIVAVVLTATNVLPLSLTDGGHLLLIALHDRGGVWWVQGAGLGILAVLVALWQVWWVAWLVTPAVMMAVFIDLRGRQA